MRANMPSNSQRIATIKRNKKTKLASLGIRQKVQESVRWFFTLLMDNSNIPVLFHYAAGKDSTGFISALVLFAQGVPKKIIVQDYLLSNQLLKGKYPFKTPIYTVEEPFLLALIEEIECSHG